MQRIDRGGAAFSIDVSVLAAAPRPGYVARLVVRQMPGMRAVFCEDVLADGHPWNQAPNALSAAVARGQQLVRYELRQRHASAVGGRHGGELAEPGAALAPPW